MHQLVGICVEGLGIVLERCHGRAGSGVLGELPQIELDEGSSLACTHCASAGPSGVPAATVDSSPNRPCGVSGATGTAVADLQRPQLGDLDGFAIGVLELAEA
jgi:hypothetical protein